MFVEDIVKIMEPVMNDLVKGEPKNEIIVCQPNETMRLRCSCAMEAFG